MLRVQQRGHKLEPFYDKPWAVLSCHNGNIYKLRNFNGIIFGNKYNKTNFFLAYISNDHPVQSLWYVSQHILRKNRKRLKSEIRDRNG
jgi:hypothetical protein